MNSFQDLITKALATATDTKEFIVGMGVITKVASLFSNYFPNSSAFLVADENTFRACGARVLAIFAENGIRCCKPLLFDGKNPITASYENLLIVRNALDSCGENAIAVAVGSGTINDLCKRASFELSRPYFSVSTAASVDGYASFGAPITKDGFKKTWPCDAPKVVLADVDVLANAPTFLSSSGYADLLAKVPSGADWILASAVGLDPIVSSVWETTQNPLRDLVANPDGIQKNDPDCLNRLFIGLAVTGFAMQATHSSRPASGAEHLFSHFWEMKEIRRPNGSHPTHGDKVGMGAIITTKLFEQFFSEPFAECDIEKVLDSYPSWENREEMIRTVMPGGVVLEEALLISKQKHLSKSELEKRLLFIAQNYHSLKEQILRQLIPSDDLVQMLKAAGCPTNPAEIGLSFQDVVDGTLGAQMIRNRYTILDLLFETGRLMQYAHECADSILLV